MIDAVLDAQNNKQAQGKGPMAELEHWRERRAALYTLYEQLSCPLAKKIVVVLETSQSHVIDVFRNHYNELAKLSIEAQDNVKVEFVVDHSHVPVLVYIGASFQDSRLWISDRDSGYDAIIDECVAYDVDYITLLQLRRDNGTIDGEN